MRVFAAFLLGLCLAVTAKAQSSSVGQWSAPISMPIVTIHTQVLPTGKLLAWGNPSTPPQDGKGQVRLWDPTATQPVYEEFTNPFVDVYCVGHTLLPDGRVLAIGGHISSYVGSDATTLFDPFSRRWINGPRMSAGRWYPTATVLGNGDVLTVSGDIDTTVGVNTLPQVYGTASGTWRDLTGARLALQLYPWMHLAPNGKVFMSGPTSQTRYLDPAGTGRWTTVASTNQGNRGEYQGASVMYEPGKVLIMGGGYPTAATAEVINLNDATPRWRYTNPMRFKRSAPNATLLPDGKVLVTGGSSEGFNDGASAVYNAEMWNPATESWTTMAPMRTSRLYHSTAVLLPDGRVFVSGGGGGGPGDIDHYDGEYYSPPYLFKGARPTLDAAPASASYGEQFTIAAGDASGIVGVTLVALSATTHEFNMSQRFLRLQFSPSGEPGRYSVTAPAHGNLAPPGYYMLFVLNANGVPSVARMLQLRSSGNAAPVVNAGADRTVVLPSSVTLTGTASDDGRPGPLTTSWSQVSGPGTVSFGNAAALSTTASFSAAGVYVLRLSASDGALTSGDNVTVTVQSSSSGGNGLTGSYYNGINFNSLVFARVDPAVNFSWGSGSPGAGVAIDGFSIRWTGEVQAPVSGTYVFSTVSNDGVRLYVNGQLVINNWTVHGTTTNASAGITLQAGARYPITMEYFENSGWGESRLLWSYPGQSTPIAIPSARLFTGAASTPNQAPLVNAGSDRTVTLPASASLSGTATDDGQPGPLTTTWSMVSGPGAVAFSNASALTTTASFSTAGVYIVRLTASDGALSSFDDLAVTVQAAPPAENQPPLVNAGADRSVTLPSSVSLSGSATDDGQPGPLTTTWSQVSGPGTVSFANAAALSTTASFSAAGAYVLRLTASDGALSSSDDMTVTVQAASTGGNGLTGRYYSGINFNSLVFTRVDPTVNFDWGSGSPGAGVPIDGFSIRWTGEVEAPASGTYTFSTISNDGVRLYVNGQLVINNWTVHGTTTDTSAAVTLEAGVRYPITMEYYENSGYGISVLRWTHPGQSSPIPIPQSRLFP